MTKQELVAQIERTHNEALDAGFFFSIDEMLPTIHVEFSSANFYFFQGEEAVNLLDNIIALVNSVDGEVHFEAALAWISNGW